MQEMLDILFNKYVVFLLAFCRMSGMVLFNPFLGRKNVPGVVKVGLSFFLALLVAGLIPNTAIDATQLVPLVLLALKELAIGFFVGFLMQLFVSAVLMAGDMIDLQLGVGMAKLYDPQSNISMPLTGSIFNLFFVISFFVSNGHLTFMKIMVQSFDILPLGTNLLGSDAGHAAVLLFGNMLVLALKLAMPILAIEVVSEIGLGVMMRAVPQINVFAVGLQIKLLVGVLFLALMMSGVFRFFDTAMDQMFQTIADSLKQAV